MHRVIKTRVYPTSGMTVEGRVEVSLAWEPVFDHEGAGGPQVGQLTLCAEAINLFHGTNLAVVEGIHQFVMYLVYPVSRTTSEVRAGCSKG